MARLLLDQIRADALRFMGLTDAATQRDNVVTAVSKLVDDTLKLWGDSTDPNVGWCNVNNPAVIQRWFNAWKQ